MSEKKDFQNNQIIRIDAKTSFVEVLNNMFNTSLYRDKVSEGRVVLNLQENKDVNGSVVKKDSIAVFLELSRFTSLTSDITSGSLVYKACLAKLDGTIDKLNFGNYEASVLSKIEEDVNDLYRLLPQASSGVALHLVNEFENNLYNPQSEGYYKAKIREKRPMNYYKPVFQVMGGTSAARANRPDKAPEARIFEITPGAISDWVLVAKAGKGKEDAKGAIQMATVERTIRVPLTHFDFKRLFITTDMYIQAQYVKELLAK